MGNDAIAPGAAEAHASGQPVGPALSRAKLAMFEEGKKLIHAIIITLQGAGRKAQTRASAFGNPTLTTFLSNGQDKGRTRIGDSCIAEDGLEKLATNPARITKPP